MASVQPPSLPNDIAARKTGRPTIYANKEIKEQMRQYLNKKKEEAKEHHNWLPLYIYQ